MNSFVFTCGDTNGIGPEIVIKSLNKIVSYTDNIFYFIIPKNIFEESITFVPPKFSFSISDKAIKSDTQVSIISLKNARLEIGKASKNSGTASYQSIKKSFELLANKSADAVVTAPISKTAINLAGINFPGHTEMFAEWCNIDNVVMTFLSKKMNAALATIHQPLKNIPKLISKKKLEILFEIILKTLIKDLNISNPKIAVLGLNPHAGENGLIGSEEIEIISPVIEKENKNFFGPFSPDAFFANHLYKKYDLVLGMYHDQVLIPFKMLNFSSGVNYTAGLPIVRTSPDHGVAYDIAWKGRADENSFLQAYFYADKIVNNRKKNGR